MNWIATSHGKRIQIRFNHVNQNPNFEFLPQTDENEWSWESLPAGMDEDFSHLDLQIEALYPRAIRPSVTVFLNSSFLLQVLLFISTILEVSANKFLSATLAQGIKLYNQ